jgi:hypothetical protein
MSQCSKIREAWANGDRLGALRITARFFDRSADTQIFKRGMDAHNIGFETENGGRTITGTTRRVHFFSRGELDKMTTAEVSDSLEHVDNIINVLDEIMDHMDGFSSAEEAWLSSITETLRTWRYVMQETYESPEGNKDD